MQSGGGEDAVVQSGFTICEKCCVGLSEFAVAANQGSLFLISFVYTSIHGASATPLGVVDVVISFYELTNGPIFGHWADQGRFNIFCMKSRIWGRRAPQLHRPCDPGPARHACPQPTEPGWFWSTFFLRHSDTERVT